MPQASALVAAEILSLEIGRLGDRRDVCASAAGIQALVTSRLSASAAQRWVGILRELNHQRGRRREVAL